MNLELEWSLWMDERFPRRINSPIFFNKNLSETEALDLETKAIKRIRSLKNVPQPRDEGKLKHDDVMVSLKIKKDELLCLKLKFSDQ